MRRYQPSTTTINRNTKPMSKVMSTDKLGLHFTSSLPRPVTVQCLELSQSSHWTKTDFLSAGVPYVTHPSPFHVPQLDLLDIFTFLDVNCFRERALMGAWAGSRRRTGWSRSRGPAAGTRSSAPGTRRNIFSPLPCFYWALSGILLN